MKLTKSKRGLLPIIWVAVSIAGIFGVGYLINSTKSATASQASVLGLNPMIWVGMAIGFGIIVLFKQR